MTLETSQIIALVFGLFILSTLLFLFLFYNVKNQKNNNNSTINEKVYYLQKWLFICFIVLLNAAGCTLVYYTQNLQVILYIIIVLKSKDILMSIMFVFNMIYRKITKKYSDLPSLEMTDEINKVICLVPCFDESYEQVCKSVDSILNTKNNLNYALPIVISDGKHNYDRLLTNTQLIKDYTYTNWKIEEISLRISYGTRNEKHMIYVTKYKNTGKKDSIIFLHDMFNYNRDNLSSSNLLLKEEIKNDLLSIFGINEFDFIFNTDADTIIDKNGISCLIDTLKTKNAIACAGLVNVDKSEGNWFWNNLQNYQYMYGQFIRRTNEDLLGQVLCLPGCISIVKVCEEFKDVIELYSNLPNEKNLFETNVQYIGTDRRFTSALIYKNSNVKILQDIRANAYTLPPQNFDEYLCQRKRWMQNTFFNSIMNIFGKNVNLLLRFFNFIDILRMCLVYFRLFNTLYFVYLLSTFYKSSNILSLVPYIVLLSYPTICFLIYSLFNSHLRNQYLSLLFMTIINKFYTFITNIVIFSVMLFNIGYFKWTIK